MYVENVFWLLSVCVNFYLFWGDGYFLGNYYSELCFYILYSYNLDWLGLLYL